MDFQLMQWRTQQHQSDQLQQHQQQAVDTKQHQQQHQSLSALPLFLTEPPLSKLGNLSDIPSTSKFPKMMLMGGGGGHGHQQQQQQFSSAQWQELELQAVIFRYMLAGASVPAELLQPIKNSLLNSSSYFLHHHFPLYQPAASACTSLQSGYWSRAGMDPEPGRCRRTDGKKWRCSRDVALGHKYCDRHMNRGRNRSRKPVELPRPKTALNPSSVDRVNAGNGELRKAADSMMGSSLGAASKVNFSHFGGASPSIDMLHHNQRSNDVSVRSPFELSHGAGSDGRVLRPFFDDWPRSMAESGGIRASTNLSMSIQGNPASDVSLKLSTGSENQDLNAERDRLQLNWMAQWGQHRAGPMGGPLAEALRSSAAHD